ncbi:MAG: hypothetical protein V4534_04590 [Myxococcota bacterium]
MRKQIFVLALALSLSAFSITGRNFVFENFEGQNKDQVAAVVELCNEYHLTYNTLHPIFGTACYPALLSGHLAKQGVQLVFVRTGELAGVLAGLTWIGNEGAPDLLLSSALSFTIEEKAEIHSAASTIPPSDNDGVCPASIFNIALLADFGLVATVLGGLYTVYGYVKNAPAAVQQPKRVAITAVSRRRGQVSNARRLEPISDGSLSAFDSSSEGMPDLGTAAREVLSQSRRSNRPYSRTPPPERSSSRSPQSSDDIAQLTAKARRWIQIFAQLSPSSSRDEQLIENIDMHLRAIRDSLYEQQIGGNAEEIIADVANTLQQLGQTKKPKLLRAHL